MLDLHFPFAEVLHFTENKKGFHSTNKSICLNKKTTQKEIIEK